MSIEGLDGSDSCSKNYIIKRSSLLLKVFFGGGVCLFLDFVILKLSLWVPVNLTLEQVYFG